MESYPSLGRCGSAFTVATRLVNLSFVIRLVWRLMQRLVAPTHCQRPRRRLADREHGVSNGIGLHGKAGATVTVVAAVGLDPLRIAESGPVPFRFMAALHGDEPDAVGIGQGDIAWCGVFVPAAAALDTGSICSDGRGQGHSGQQGNDGGEGTDRRVVHGQFQSKGTGVIKS